ncbi:MAG: YdiU family protein [Candidatus Tectimicrobiota bacterium]
MPYESDTLPFRHTFATLPPAFYTRLQPTPLPDPYLVGVSPAAAALIDLEPGAWATERFVQAFSGNRLPAGALPLAAVYSGHQFGAWAGQLGDGRAILLGDVPASDPAAPGSLEVQLKGAGLTPYSRMGDGRAVLRSSIREFLCSEAMAALGIPTSRALCVIGSDYQVLRETPETTAVVTRLAPSFVRFGSFEHWSARNDTVALQTLADFVLERWYPDLRAAHNPYQALLAEVTRRTARLMAQWQGVGFMHGVMNTDNMSILGLTIDYGPFGFMEAFDDNHICNHTDEQGRYAYRMQPHIGHWNCAALGRALLPLIGNVEAAQEALDLYQSAYRAHWDDVLHAKLGLSTRQPEDLQLLEALFTLLQKGQVDFTLFFRRLADVQRDSPVADAPVRDLCSDRAACEAWIERYRARLQAEHSEDGPRRQAMQAVNPKYVLRNYLAQIAIDKAQQKDFSEVDRLRRVLEKPYDEQPEYEQYAALPPAWASTLAVSCSS